MKTELRNEVATINKDITQPVFGGIIRHNDDTLITRGQGRGLRIYDDIERDCHAFAVLQKRKMAVIGREWDVEPFSKSLRDRKAADLVRRQLANLSCQTPDDEILAQATGFDAACLNLMDAHLKGFAVGEIIWATDGSEIVASEIRPKNQLRFEFVPGNVGYKLNLKTWSNLLPGETVPPRKFIVHNFGSKDGNPYGLGLGTRLFWPVFFKRQDITFWLAFVDKFAAPTAIGTYPSSAKEDEKRTLLNALSAIASEAGVIVPEGMAISLLEAARSGSIDSYEKLARYMDEQISEAVLGETGSTNQSNGGGSRARDQVGNEVRLELVKADSDMLSGTINSSLIKWMVELNLPGANPPKVWRDCSEPQDLKAQAERDGVLAEKCGVQLTAAYFQREYGFQEGDIETVAQPIAAPAAPLKPAEPAAAFAEATDPGAMPAEDALFDYAAQEAAQPVEDMITAAEQLLDQVTSLEEFQSRLIELYAQAEPDRLAVVMARLGTLANLAGRVDVNNE